MRQPSLHLEQKISDVKHTYGSKSYKYFLTGGVNNMEALSECGGTHQGDNATAHIILGCQYQSPHISGILPLRCCSRGIAAVLCQACCLRCRLEQEVLRKIARLQSHIELSVGVES